MKVKIAENILHLDITNQTKKLKKGDIFYVPKIYNLYLVNDMSIDKDKDKVNVKTGQLSDEEKMSFISTIDISGSSSGIEYGSIFPAEGVTVEYY